MKNVPEGIDRVALREAFEKFGIIQHIDYPTGKPIAFVVYKSVESVANVLGKTVEVNGVQITADERKRGLNNHVRPSSGSNFKHKSGEYRGSSRGGKFSGRGRADKTGTAA